MSSDRILNHHRSPLEQAHSHRIGTMKLNIVIKAGKVKQEIVVPIGDGAQTFKWLATVAAQRLVSDGARHGRHLPHRCDRHSLPARTNLLPKNVYTSVCPFLHPDDVIKEHVSDVDTVIVELYMPMEFDVFGAPNLSKWSFIAFRHHQWHREKREREHSLRMLSCIR